jgi:hypothetical protein
MKPDGIVVWMEVGRKAADDRGDEELTKTFFQGLCIMETDG